MFCCIADCGTFKADSATVSIDLFRYTQLRGSGLKGYSNVKGQTLADNYVANLMPQLFQEKECRLGCINKIFASQWLNENQVVFGTKCNKVSQNFLPPFKNDYWLLISAFF